MPPRALGLTAGANPLLRDPLVNRTSLARFTLPATVSLLVPVAHGLDVLENSSIGVVRRTTRGDGPFEEGAER